MLEVLPLPYDEEIVDNELFKELGFNDEMLYNEAKAAGYFDMKI